MAYFSLNEDFQRLGSFGCGGKCRCGPCARRRAGRASDEPGDASGPPPLANNRSVIGEPPQGPPLVLQPTRLFQDNPTPPLVRRMRGVMSGGLTPPTLHPPFQPTPPPRPPDLFRLSPEFQRELIEKWERERRIRELTAPTPPAQRLSLGDAIRRYLDNNLDRLMSDLRVPRSLRGHIRDAIGRGATEALNHALTQMAIGGKAREAIISSSVRAAIGQIRVR
jgi:hypothetical protein